MKSLTPQKGALAFCSRQELGLITSDAPVEVTYPDNSTGLAWTGIHLSEAKLGEQWSSREPRVVGLVKDDHYATAGGVVIGGRGASRAFLYL